MEPKYFPAEAEFRRWLHANHKIAPELLECSAAGTRIPDYDIGTKR